MKFLYNVYKFLEGGDRMDISDRPRGGVPSGGTSPSRISMTVTGLKHLSWSYQTNGCSLKHGPLSKTRTSNYKD